MLITSLRRSLPALLTLSCALALTDAQPVVADPSPATQPAAPASCPSGACPAPPAGAADAGPVAPADAATTAPAPAADPVVDPAVVQWLDRIEAQSKTTTTLQATLRYDRVEGLTGSRQRRFGSLIYVAGPPARFAAHFDRLLVDRRLDKQDRWYIFDGIWFVERVIEPDKDAAGNTRTVKRFIKRQVVAPGQESTVANPLALGSGPFPLPVTLQKDVVLRRFDAVLSTDEPAEAPVNAVHLKLTPRPGQRVNATQIDLWYDKDRLIPVRVRAEDADSEAVTIIDLTDARVNEPVDPRTIDTTPPTESGWDIEVRPWE